MIFVALLIRHVATPKDPRLLLPTFPLSLGQGKPNETLHGWLPLTNAGDLPLKFTIDADCSCTELMPRQGEIPPQDTLTVQIGVKLPAQVGSERNIQLQIQSNDPASPSQSYDVTVACPAPVNVSPTALNFGRVLQGQSRTLQLVVSRSETNPGLQCNAIECSLDHRFLTVETASATAEDMVLTVELSGDAPATLVTGRIELRNADEILRRVSVTADVVGAIGVAPRVLTLRRSPAASQARTAEFMVWSNTESALSAAVAIACPDDCTVAEIGSVGKFRRYRVSTEASNDERDEVRLTFDGGREAVVDIQ